MMKKTFALSVIALGTALSTVAQATTTTGTLNVTATITSSCSVNTTATGSSIGNSTLNFGTVSNFQSATDANTGTTAGGAGAINVLCNNGTSWTLAFDGGSNASSGQRRMAGGTSEYIPYNLYADSAYSTAIAVNGTVKGTGTGGVQAVPVYGRIPAGTILPSASTYLDTVTMTITY